MMGVCTMAIITYGPLQIGFIAGMCYRQQKGWFGKHSGPVIIKCIMIRVFNISLGLHFLDIILKTVMVI